MTEWGARGRMPWDWDEIEQDAPHLIDDAWERVSRVLWAKADALWELPHPFLAQRHGENPVSSASEHAKDASRSVKYGYDDGDRLIAARRFRSQDEAAVESDVIWTPSPAGDEIVLECPRDGHGVMYVRRIARPRRDQSGRLSEIEEWWNPGRSTTASIRETYAYEDAALVAIRVEACYSDHPSGNDYGGAEYQVHLDRAGNADRVEVRNLDPDDEIDAPWHEVWKRTDAQAVRDAASLLHTAVPDAIASWAGRQELTSPAFAMAIAYDPTRGADLRPSLALGTEADIAGWSAAAPEVLWNPAEYGCFDSDPAEFTEGPLAAAFEVVRIAWGDETERKLSALYATTAKQLQARPHLVRQSASEFVVFAIDLELEDLDGALRRSGVSAARQRAVQGLGAQPQ